MARGHCPLLPRTSRSRAALLLGALAGLTLLPGCGSKAPKSPPGEEGRSWYVLRGGRLESSPTSPAPLPLSADSSAASGPHYVPWTVQERVADLLVREGTLFVAVNGQGVAWAPLPLAPDQAFRTAFSPQIFAGRTLSSMFPVGPRLILHLYVNRTIAEALPGGPEPENGPYSLLAFGPLDAGEPGASYSPLPVPFQRVHPDWEAVAVVPVSLTALGVEWKHTDRERTEFSYTRFDLVTRAETPMERGEYRAAYTFDSPSSAGVDHGLRILFEAVLRHLERSGGAGPGTAVHLLVRGAPVPERLRFQPPGYAERDDMDLVVVPACRTSDLLWSLTPDGELFGVREGAKDVLAQSLPALPEGYRYTSFALVDGAGDASVVAAWEETVFARVGEAGLYAGPVRLPAP